MDIGYIATAEWLDPSVLCGFSMESSADETFLDVLNQDPYWADYQQYGDGTLQIKYMFNEYNPYIPGGYLPEYVVFNLNSDTHIPTGLASDI